jgi:hypothetical protein
MARGRPTSANICRELVGVFATPPDPRSPRLGLCWKAAAALPEALTL